MVGVDSFFLSGCKVVPYGLVLLRMAPASRKIFLSIGALSLLTLLAGCSSRIFQKNSVKPKTLHDVPVERLAFHFESDVAAPANAGGIDVAGKIMPELQAEFDKNRANEALLRTVVSPDKTRILAVYAGADTPEGEFRIDLYANDMRLLKQVTPEGLSGEFAPTVSWSPDGNYLSFIGRRAAAKPVNPNQPLPEDLPPIPGLTPPPATPVPSSVPIFETEQIYLATRDGTDLKPLTMRPGLIYFYFTWSPDSHSLAALACLERDWEAREAEGNGQIPAGRPRVISVAGKERLLDDKLSPVWPVWCPDGSKIAIGYDYDVKLYDAAGDKPGQALAPTRDPLLAASRAYDTAKGMPASDGDPVSFYPVANLVWSAPETIYMRTGYVPKSENDRPVNVFSRWHAVRLSAQAALLN
jgi:hypothetical protein